MTGSFAFGVAPPSPGPDGRSPPSDRHSPRRSLFALRRRFNTVGAFSILKHSSEQLSRHGAGWHPNVNQSVVVSCVVAPLHVVHSERQEHSHCQATQTAYPGVTI